MTHAHTPMFDTLSYANKLKAAGISAEHADVQAETLAETLSEVLTEVKQEMHKTFATKADLKEEVSRLEKWIQQLQADMNVKFAEVYKAIAESKAEMIRWFLGISISQALLVFSMLKFMH